MEGLLQGLETSGVVIRVRSCLRMYADGKKSIKKVTRFKPLGSYAVVGKMEAKTSTCPLERNEQHVRIVF